MKKLYVLAYLPPYMVSPMDAAWSVLKADIDQVYGFGGFSRQTMPPLVRGMLQRERERQSAKAVEESLRTGSMAPLAEWISPKAELSGEARNRYDFLAPWNKQLGEGGRNFPTEGGPDNEPSIPYNKPWNIPRPFDQPQFSVPQQASPMTPPMDPDFMDRIDRKRREQQIDQANSARNQQERQARQN